MAINTLNIYLNLKHNTEKTGAWITHIFHSYLFDLVLALSKEHELIDASTNRRIIATTTESNETKYTLIRNKNYILKLYNISTTDNPFSYIKIPNVQNINYATVFSMFGRAATLTTPNQLIPNSNSFSISDNYILSPVFSDFYVANNDKIYNLPADLNAISPLLYTISKFSQTGDAKTHLVLKAVLNTENEVANKIDSYTLLSVGATALPLEKRIAEEQSNAENLDYKNFVLAEDVYASFKGRSDPVSREEK